MTRWRWGESEREREIEGGREGGRGEGGGQGGGEGGRGGGREGGRQKFVCGDISLLCLIYLIIEKAKKQNAMA